MQGVRDAVLHYYRIRVRNAGPAQAQSCEVVLEGIWFRRNDAWVKVDYWEADNLHWAREMQSPRERHINRDRRVFADIGHVSSQNRLRTDKMSGRIIDWPSGRSDEPRLVLDLITNYHSQPNALAPGAYVFTVAVHCANGGARRIHLELQFEPEDFGSIEAHGILGEPVPGVTLRQVFEAPIAFDKARSALAIAESESI